MHNGDGYSRIQHREFIRDLDLYDIFDPVTFNLNPTDETVFPWLSNVARNYEMYKFRGIVIGYRGQGTTFSETGSLGSISLATQYDVQDLHFTTKGEMLSTLFCTSCKPSDSMMHAIECDPNKTPTLPLYTGVNETTIPTEVISSNTLGLDLNSLQLMVGPTFYSGAEHIAITTHNKDLSPYFRAGDTLTISSFLATSECLTWMSRKVLAVNVNELNPTVTEIVLEGISPASPSTVFGTIVIELSRSRAVLSRDTRLNDFARTTLSAQGPAPATKIGELWISYDVEFFKPSIRIGETAIATPVNAQLLSVHRAKLRLGPELQDRKFVVYGDQDPLHPHPDYISFKEEVPAHSAGTPSSGTPFTLVSPVRSRG